MKTERPLVHESSCQYRKSFSLCTCGGQSNDKALLNYAFSALIGLAGRQERHPACKNLSVVCWHGYLSGARCRLAYGPTDATATCFSETQIAFTFLVPAHLGSPGKRAVKRVCVCVLWRFDYFGSLQFGCSVHVWRRQKPTRQSSIAKHAVLLDNVIPVARCTKRFQLLIQQLPRRLNALSHRPHRLGPESIHGWH